MITRRNFLKTSSMIALGATVTAVTSGGGMVPTMLVD